MNLNTKSIVNKPENDNSAAKAPLHPLPGSALHWEVEKDDDGNTTWIAAGPCECQYRLVPFLRSDRVWWRDWSDEALDGNPANEWETLEEAQEAFAQNVKLRDGGTETNNKD